MECELDLIHNKNLWKSCKAPIYMKYITLHDTMTYVWRKMFCIKNKK